MNKKLLSYLIIGISCASGTFILSNLFILGYSKFAILNPAVSSVCFFVASVIMILPSFFLNRKTTFGDKERKSSRVKTILKAYSIYILSPLIASIITYLMQKSIDFEAIDILINGFDFNYGRYFLQIVAIGISTVGNFLGQKLWIYK